MKMIGMYVGDKQRFNIGIVYAEPYRIHKGVRATVEQNLSINQRARSAADVTAAEAASNPTALTLAKYRRIALSRCGA
jgi:hypothetical protein